MSITENVNEVLSSIEKCVTDMTDRLIMRSSFIYVRIAVRLAGYTTTDKKCEYLLGNKLEVGTTAELYKRIKENKAGYIRQMMKIKNIVNDPHNTEEENAEYIKILDDTEKLIEIYEILELMIK